MDSGKANQTMTLNDHIQAGPVAVVLCQVPLVTTPYSLPTIYSLDRSLL